MNPTKRRTNSDKISHQISACFGNEVSMTSSSNETHTCEQSVIVHPLVTQTKTLPRKYNVPDINVTGKQLVLSFKSDSETELLVSLAALSASLTNVSRPERIYGTLTWDSFVVSTILDSKMTVLLNPCCCNATISLVWETWQSDSNAPNIQIQADSDCVYLNLGPKHILVIQTLLPDFHEILAKLTSRHSNRSYEEEPAILTTHEQHYKDDLKSGAFQFVDGYTEELPFPYQVM